jgi:hypothetical protein
MFFKHTKKVYTEPFIKARIRIRFRIRSQTSGSGSDRIRNTALNTRGGGDNRSSVFGFPIEIKHALIICRLDVILQNNNYIIESIFLVSSLIMNQSNLRVVYIQYFTAVLRSRSRKEPHHLVGAGAVKRCSSGSDGSGSVNGIKHGKELKNDTNCRSYNPFSSYFQQYKSYRIIGTR